MGAGRSSFRVKAMSSFHVGQLVCCVDAEQEDGCWWWFDVPEEGRVYQIRAERLDCFGRHVLHLFEILNGKIPEIGDAAYQDSGYLSSRFRPAKLASKEVFDQLTAPLKFKRENAREEA